MTSRSSPGSEQSWLIVKRGLFFRPDCQGYTGIRDKAGRYSYDFAKDYDRGECSIMREADAPEFMPAAFSDLVIKHLMGQRAHWKERHDIVLQKHIECCSAAQNPARPTDSEILAVLNAAIVALKSRDQSSFEIKVLEGLKVAMAMLEALPSVSSTDRGGK